MKGEEIVKDLMDYYAGLSHVRGSTELVETTDTTYTELEYEDSPVWDILKYVAESADKSGVIGFDFRVAPDGKFEFFPKLSKTNSTVITENIDTAAEYEKDITRIRNKVVVYGLADKSYPSNKVDWTNSLTPSDGSWSASIGAVSLDATGNPTGGPCIKLSVSSNYAGVVDFNLSAGHEVNFDAYTVLDLQLKMQDTYAGTGFILLMDTAGRFASKTISISPDAAFHVFETGVGSAYANQWDRVDSGFNWAAVQKIRVSLGFSGVGSGSFWVYALYAGGRRYSGVAESTPSQTAYGLREYVEEIGRASCRERVCQYV
jgi:hypothetical protein